MPTTANKRLTRARNHKGMVTTKEYREWMEEAQWLIKSAAVKGGWKIAAEKPVSVNIFYYCFNRKRDVDNVIKPVMDAASGIIYEDDRWVYSVEVERVLNEKRKEEYIDVVFSFML